MNFKLKILVASISIITITSTTVTAQNNKSSYGIGFNLGTLVYRGDLSTGGSNKYSKPAIGINVTKELDTYFALQANLMFGKIGLDESQFYTPAWKQDRRLKFTTSIAELSTVLVWNILGNSYDGYERKLSPYVFGGAGLSFLNVNRDWHNVNMAVFDSHSALAMGLGIDTLHSTPKLIPIIPVGFGIKYAISNCIGIKAEAAYRFTFSDYLDGFSYSVNPSTKDSYYGLSIGISYKLIRNSFRCPSVIR